MARLEKIKPGDVLYDVHSYRMGNTTLRSLGLWKVQVIEVHETYALCSWNGNTPTKFYHCQLSKLKTKKPILVSDAFGRQRRATKEEIKNMAAKQDTVS